MRLLFVRSNAILSRAICAATGEPASHVALESKWVVLHSTHKGVHLELRKNFRRKYEVVAEVEVAEINLERLSDMEGRGYDFGAFAFFMWAMFMARVFNRPLPKRNAWAANDAFLCVEVARVPGTEGLDLAMMTPWRLYQHLANHPERIYAKCHNE